ncbi:MAG TPA: carbohydrate binding domain-containing protein [Methylomirabilota bacterium]|nr:carbohydrate binding domain-containing protein [Methylomirabilota bacterium]
MRSIGMPGTNYPLAKKLARVQTALVIGLVLRAGLVAAQNLVTNPGFETGNTSGWFAFGSPTLAAEASQVHSGSYACLVTNRTATWNGIAQSFVGVLQSGQNYDVSAWVKLVSGGNQTMQLTMQKTDGSGTSYAAIASGSVSSSGWTALSGQYTYTPSGSVTALNFYAEMPSSSNTSYYIDDVSFSPATIVTNSSITGVSAVDWDSLHQRIDGFGASSAWNGSWTVAQADLLFSTNNNITYQSSTYNGVGLSLLRNHIAFANTTSASDTPTTVETGIMQMAQARGARVWSAPWTPAAGFKSLNDIYDTNSATAGGINGGSYLGSGNNATNQAYASQLANYVARMKNNYGVNLYALSLQNEPDANVTSYEACQWTGAQFHDFITNLYAALAAQGVGSTKIMLAESQNWTDPRNLAGPTLSDPSVLAQVGIIANHDYVANNSVGDQSVPAAIATGGKAMWETEVALLSGSDSSIANGVYWARRIHQYLTQAQANAYHYWWLVASDNGGLIVNSAPAKRLFAFGQYSRFVRPNFYRVNATSSQPSTLISAYKATNSTAFALVVVNTNAATEVIQTFNLTNFTSSSVTPWITSASLSLAPQAPVNVTNFSFTYDVPAMSIVTFVGQANTPPKIGPVANQTVNPGATLLVTNTASDSDLPPQALTFAAANMVPANATINASNGVFSWRPLVSQAGTTNLIQIKVIDSGQPNLSATNSFNVMVNPVSQPVLSSIAVSGGQINLLVNGPSGPDYTLLTSTNLVAWQPTLTLTSPVPPLVLVDTNFPIGIARFYRIQLGP